MNRSIELVRSVRLNYSCPKVLEYTDDITVLTSNKDSSVHGILYEYERLTAASALKLNADKTE